MKSAARICIKNYVPLENTIEFLFKLVNSIKHLKFSSLDSQPNFLST